MNKTDSSPVTLSRAPRIRTILRREWPYHVMLLPVIVFLLIFSITPMFGYVIAFKKFVPSQGILGSEFVGLRYIRFMFQLPDSWRIFRNTLIIAVSKIVCNLVVPVIFALMLNEIRSTRYKRTVQTIVYLPHFLSWVVLAIPIKNLLAYHGIVNNVIDALGGTRIMFMSSTQWFRWVLVVTDTWKEFGFGTIIYLAAITSINPSLYEAAVIDGAKRGQCIWHITLPGIMATIVLMATRSIGGVLSAGFDQVYNLYSPVVYEVADIVDTYVYRTGLIQMNYSLSTAVNLIKSVIGMFLISLSNYMAYRFANYRIF